MPKLKRSEEEEIARRIRANIAGRKAYLGVSHDELAYAARVSPATLYNHLNRPGDIRLAELIRLSQKLGLSLKQMILCEEKEAGTCWQEGKP